MDGRACVIVLLWGRKVLVVGRGVSNVVSEVGKKCKVKFRYEVTCPIRIFGKPLDRGKICTGVYYLFDEIFELIL